MKLKCIIRGCETRGLAESGYDFFVCEEHLNGLAELAEALDEKVVRERVAALGGGLG